MDSVIAFTNKLTLQFPAEKISVNDVIVKGLRQCRSSNINGLMLPFQNNAVRFYEDADINSIAVAIEDGLITPVIACGKQKGLPPYLLK